MANPVPAGSDVSAGTYRCTNCGKTIDVGSTKHLPPCPSCSNGEWEPVRVAATPRPILIRRLTAADAETRSSRSRG